MTRNQKKGQLAENWAKKYLQGLGFGLICENYRCPGGECDLMMSDGDEVVLIEVKYRSNQAFGTAIESINAKKLQSMERCVAHFFHKVKNQDQIPPYRFDLLLFDGKNGKYMKNVSLED